MERVEITKEDLDALAVGAVFKFLTHDMGGNTELVLKYCKTKVGYIYPGGRLDCR